MDGARWISVADGGVDGCFLTCMRRLIMIWFALLFPLFPELFLLFDRLHHAIYILTFAGYASELQVTFLLLVNASFEG